MAKMTWGEKEKRRQARYWARSCRLNMDWVMRSEQSVVLWNSIADRMERINKTETDEKERQERIHAIEHARMRAEKDREIIRQQTLQTFVNARRAFHAAIEARDGSVKL
jgi:hypothetical protein